MSITIKLLVELNNEKYSVFVESDYKFVKFKTVSNEIITQLNQNISLKTHLFELFDPDFGEYVLVTNENQVVENLSRIRIKAKDPTPVNDYCKGVDGVNDKLDEMVDNGLETRQSNVADKELDRFCDYLFGTTSKNLIENVENNKSLSKQQPIASSAKTLNDFIENNLSEKTKDLAKYLFNFNETTDKLINKEINVDKVVESTEDLISQSTDDTVVEASNQSTIRNSGSPQPPEEAINYLNLVESNNYGVSPSCPHLYHKTFVEMFRRQLLVIIRIRYEDFKAILKLLELLDVNRRCFQKYPKNDDPSNPKWKVVSDQMIINGFDDWSADKCKLAFNNALQLYRKTLDKCPDYETAVKVNPLFATFHNFDMKFVISLSEFNVVRDLRDLFSRKLSKFSHKSGFSQRKFHSNQSLVQKSSSMSSSVSSPTKPRERIFQSSAKMGSNMSLQSMSNGLDNKISKSRSQIDKLKLKNIGLKVDNHLIVNFMALAKNVDTISAQFGHVSKNAQFWEMVSSQMKANGYKTCSWRECYQMFTEHVCDYYSLALTYSSDVMNAQQMYPLFDFIHSMDLSRCLSPYSYDRIKDLRAKFAQKSDFFGQMFIK